MKSSVRTAAILLAVGALLLTSSPAQAQGSWRSVASPNERGSNTLYGVDASDAGHVWAVGRLTVRNGAASQSRVLQHDGTAWRAAPLSGFPGYDALFDVDAVSGNEAWAAGTSYAQIGRSSTLVARWNGSTWAPESTPNGNPSSTNHLAGVAAAGGTVWAVGSYFESGSWDTRRGLILQRTGGTWRLSPAPRVLAVEFLEGIDATGPTDAWAVGWGSNSFTTGPSAPIALRWNGTRWQSVPLPATASTSLYAVEALTPTNVWVAGQTATSTSGQQPYVAHFDGTSWRRFATPTISSGGRLTDIVALSPSNIIAVGTVGNGSGSIVLHWNGSSWTREVSPAGPEALQLAGAAVVEPNTFWAVGNGFDLGAYQERNFTMVRG
jgi:hypothetical protein